MQWLVPGFVNAHCHLEYSWLGSGGSDSPLLRPLPRGAIPFGDWMQAIISARPLSLEDFDLQHSAMKSAAEALLRGGCTTVVDSTTDGASAAVLAMAGLRHFLFYEVLGLSQERAEPIWRVAAEAVRAGSASGKKPDSALFAGAGFNPHAPYSVGPWLRAQLDGAGGAGYAQAWHVGETPDEDELFQTGDGSIADFLRSRGMLMPYEPGPPPGCSAFQYLFRESRMDRGQAIFHGNTLSEAEALKLSTNGIIVHCPGTHRWFQRPPVPLKSWLDAGVHVCLGTDSLASSDTLSMLEIMRMTLEDNSDLSVDNLLQMSCYNPAQVPFLKTTGLDGTLTVGAPSDFVSLGASAPMVWEQLFGCEDTIVDMTWVAGAKSW